MKAAIKLNDITVSVDIKAPTVTVSTGSGMKIDVHGVVGTPGEDYVLTQEDKEEIAGQISTDIEDQLNELLDALLESTVGPAVSVSVSDALPIRPRELTVKLAATQSGSGDPSPENIRPISGATGLTLTHSAGGETRVYTVTWETSAGTVYQGILDALAGTLTVDSMMVTLSTIMLDDGSRYRSLTDLGDCWRLALTYIAADGSISAYNTWTNLFSEDNNEAISDWLKKLEKTDDAYTKNEVGFYLYGTHGFYVKFPKSSFANADEIETFLSEHPLHILIGSLTNPTVYHVDPVSIKLGRGSNTITTNVGEIMLRCAQEQTESVTDVQINGSSIVENGVANAPIASANTPGVVKIGTGLAVNSSDVLYVRTPTDANVKAGTSAQHSITPEKQHAATFYGLAKAAGDTTQRASSNAVGAYTDEAKAAIQKMLGIYEAPWELIREDTVTNNTEADIVVNADSNGQAFELTDVRLVLVSPKQDTAFSKADYGRVRMYYQMGAYDFIFIGAYTQAAGANAKVSYIRFEQSDGMLVRSVMPNTSRGGMGPLQTYATEDGEGCFVLTDTPRVYNKINITKVTGTLHYILYGKRKVV